MAIERVALYLQDAHDLRDGLRYAKYAEEKGFEAIWQAESRLVRDAIVPMAAYAAVTEKIKVGSGVINNWTRNIGLLAATFLTLDDLAPGRVICGIGAWWDPLAKNVGIERRKPLAAMRETVELLRRLLNMESVTFHGEFHSVEGIELDVIHGRREPRQVPILIGATGLKMMELAGEISDPAPLADAVALIAVDQTADGSWQLDTSGSIGSPATYGRALVTWAALRALRQAAVPDLNPVIARADAWVRGVEVQTVIDSAAVVLALGGADDTAALAQRQRCLELIMEGRAPSGGWGAYLTSAVEPFDTALVLLALQPLLGRPELAVPTIDAGTLEGVMRGGRAFLLEEQLGDGSWVETTRPAGQQSYAQYISTTGWATLALLATR